MPRSLGMVAGFGVAQPCQKFGRTVSRAGASSWRSASSASCSPCTWPAIGVTPWQMSPALVVTGLGHGLLMAPFFDIVLAGVEDHETGSASGALTAVQQLGSALGVAVLGTLFFGLLGGSSAGHPASAPSATPRRCRCGSAPGWWCVAFALTFLLPLRAREDAVGH